LAKYRKVQHDLEEAEERADNAENSLSKIRTKNRTSVSATRGSVSKCWDIVILQIIFAGRQIFIL
jgi:hypothetical protein